MPTLTTVHSIDKPLGNENVTRAAYNAVLDKIDAIVRGITPMTIAQRDALTAGQKWTDRVVRVTDAAAGQEFQRWTGSSWSTDLFSVYALDSDLATHVATIKHHTDVSDAAPAEGYVLRWRAAGGGAYVPEVLPTTSLADAIPPAIADAGAIGASTDAAREDHTHAPHAQMSRLDTAQTYTATKTFRGVPSITIDRVGSEGSIGFSSNGVEQSRIYSRVGGFLIQGAGGAGGGGEVYSGSGTPEGAKTAPVGSIFLRTDGGAGTSFYVKQTGSGNTGWVGK